MPHPYFRVKPYVIQIFWRERKKRVEARKAETKETSQSNEENVENEGSILSAQETEVEFKGIGGQGSSKNQELNTRDESFQAYRQQELEKLLEDDTNSRVLEDSKTEPGHEEQKICGETIRDSKSLEELDKINENLPKSESVLTREDMENAEINSANTRGMTNSGAISAPEEEEEETGTKLVQETGTKLVQDNHKSNDVEVVSSNGERESIVTMTRDQTAMDIEVNSGNEDNAE
ncbi:hypothetical protein AWC38_SpisGene5799 [Stylophora pistillata]|uniref:Uncharacterized protein n=1 Tax=Stylophora pistillata TaxID=50429 RepID=A0A2B4SK40_STYPI|nr:hypothetical protein AWC38_SpisGene5799 [Stylophora pistillata]